MLQHYFYMISLFVFGYYFAVVLRIISFYFLSFFFFVYFSFFFYLYAYILYTKNLKDILQLCSQRYVLSVYPLCYYYIFLTVDVLRRRASITYKTILIPKEKKNFQVLRVAYWFYSLEIFYRNIFVWIT